MNQQTSEASSKYFTSLDSESQNKLEQSNLKDSHTDVLLMSTHDFRTQFPEMLKADADIFIGSSDKKQDAQGRTYGTLSFTTTDKPYIIREGGAIPCSLVFAFDQQGNFGVIHMVRYSQIGRESLGKKETDKQIRELEQFILNNMDETARVIISATNINSEHRAKVEDSIKTVFETFDQSKIESLYVNGDNVKKESSPERAYQITKDHIESVYFIPKSFTKDGKNKVILVGDKEGADTTDSTWLARSWPQLYPARKRTE